MAQIVHWVQEDPAGLGRSQLAGTPASEPMAVPMMLLGLVEQLGEEDEGLARRYAELGDWCARRILQHVQVGSWGSSRLQGPPLEKRAPTGGLEPQEGGEAGSPHASSPQRRVVGGGEKTEGDRNTSSLSLPGVHPLPARPRQGSPSPCWMTSAARPAVPGGRQLVPRCLVWGLRAAPLPLQRDGQAVLENISEDGRELPGCLGRHQNPGEWQSRLLPAPSRTRRSFLQGVAGGCRAAPLRGLGIGAPTCLTSRPPLPPRSRPGSWLVPASLCSPQR